VKGIAYFVRCKLKTRYTHVLSRFIFALYSGKTFIFRLSPQLPDFLKSSIPQRWHGRDNKERQRKQIQSLSIRAGWRDKDDRLGPL
jgi:hypothetical protein